MGVELGIEFPAGVVVVNSDDYIAGGAVVIGAGAADPGSGVEFEFREGLYDRLLMGLDQALVAGQFGHDGDGFGSGEGEVIEVAFAAAYGSVGCRAIGAVALPKELTGPWIETLAEGLEVLVFDRTGESQ
jgi:hypothetical protein